MGQFNNMKTQMRGHMGFSCKVGEGGEKEEKKSLSNMYLLINFENKKMLKKLSLLH